MDLHGGFEFSICLRKDTESEARSCNCTYFHGLRMFEVYPK